MNKRENLDLLINQLRKFYLYTDKLDIIIDELEQLISDNKMNTLDFAQKVMMKDEIRNNNLIEGYRDEINYIDDFVQNNHHKLNAKDKKDQRI